MNIEIKINEVQIDNICTVINFLKDNQQYGDDWSEEIIALETVVDAYYDECAALHAWENQYFDSMVD